MAGETTKDSGGFAVLEGLGGLTVIKQIGLMVGLALSISLGMWVVLMSQEPDFRPLYTDISHLEAGQVADLLQRENIRYKVDTSSGMILVESEKIHQARMKLAAEGFPSGNTMGYELLDKEQGFGTSQFMEKTRYYRSIEGELARTISSMNRVRGARVHLAIPKRSVFVNDNRKPSASVFVELYPNQSMERMQVASIVHLVASSIPELEDKHVTVVDQRGQLLSETDADEDIAMAAKQLDYAKILEQKYIDRITNMLDPLVGREGFKVQVSADLDFSQTEQTSEYFSPDLPAVRSEQTLSEVVGAGGETAGVPGALSNQPPGAVTVPEQAGGAAGEAAGATSGNVRKQATRNFELDRTISHTKHQVGVVKRLTVAVVLDDILAPPAEGAASKEPQRVSLTDAELERIRILVRDAIGFNAARGDSVTVVNQPFRKYAPEIIEDIPPPPIWEQPWFWDLAKRGSGFLLVIFLIFGVLRPILKKLADSGRDDTMAALESQLGEGLLAGAGGVGGEAPDVTLTGTSNPLLPGPDASYDQHLDAVKSMVADDPRRVAQVVKTWISND
ncbi:flagellar basal-body MS-ring/collar protein FliF [Ketobacter alkanivorans]|uniref:Flagellar M-ring protein n=1 Tax=Ketobacter alkanivorans TaxID=1917421 RepID=A0A2K9LGY7_9GAMM|nr:flagellar basal-body MS-ring/collar protein FliF [Ketobacter alkanivorans]AUM11628.1 flagellar M-ring protein FliF [Ketobacter alkanivorans]